MAVLVKTLDGLAYASVKTRDALAVASAKAIVGLDVTAGGGFSPADIADLFVDLNGDDAPSGSIAVWPDSSGNGFDAAEASNKPAKSVSTINGHGIVSFTGSSRLKIPFSFPTDSTVFFVAANTGTPGSGVCTVCCGDAYNSGFEVFLSNTFADGSNMYYAGGVDSGGPGTGYLRLNGVAAASPPNNYPSSGFAVGTAARVAGAGSTNITVGLDDGTGQGSNIDIARWIVYSRKLTIPEVEQVEDYLGTWSALTVTH